MVRSAHSFDLIEGDVILSAIMELRGARRLLIRNLLCDFKFAGLTRACPVSRNLERGQYAYHASIKDKGDHRVADRQNCPSCYRFRISQNYARSYCGNFRVLAHLGISCGQPK
jgi:hypothetical protein